MTDTLDTLSVSCAAVLPAPAVLPARPWALTDLQSPLDLQSPNPIPAALFFLDGHYLFRYREGETTRSKFVTAPDVAAAFTQTDLDTSWIPAGVIRMGHTAKGPFFVYSAPAQKVKVQLSESEDPLTIPIPRTVMLGLGCTYYLWAVKDTHFNRDAKVFRAPFPNVYLNDGRVCWGAHTPATSVAATHVAATGVAATHVAQDARKVWDLFFATPFNRDLAQGKSSAHKNDVRDLLRPLAGKNAYPLADLIEDETSVSIGGLIDQTLRR